MDEFDDESVCLVVGGSGFLGARIVNFLLEGGAKVKIIDRVAPPHSARGVEIYLGDFRDQELLSAALKGVDTVFHTASVIDVSPFPTPTMNEINVEGTKTLLEACANSGVKSFIYTSSIDVVFNGKPIQHGDESLPYITKANESLCPYGYTKAEAEQYVLRMNQHKGMRTVALRPSHIFGPGDFMISQVLTMAANDQIPFRFGFGENDYIYVDNAAVAHVQCWRALLKNSAAIEGKPFFISDYHVNIWQHLNLFLSCHKIQAPTTSLPMSLVYFVAVLMHIVASVLRKINIQFNPVLTRYTVLAVGQDFFFNSDSAKRAFGFRSIVPLRNARQQTVQWIMTLNLNPVAPLCIVHIIHLFYGLLLCMFGALQFLFPWKISSLLGLDPSPLPASPAVLSQTVGLIVFVLGVYSVVACFGRWSLSFFQVAVWPKLITGAILYLQLSTQRVPHALMYPAALEILVGLLTLMFAFDDKMTFTLRLDRVTAAQLLHAVSSGLFTAVMMVRPALILPYIVPSDPQIAHNHSVLAWAYCMGTAEWMMTWTYTASAFIVELEPFVRLSIATRLGAVAVLAAGFYFGMCSSAQLYGVLPDGVLAIISALALARAPARRKLE